MKIITLHQPYASLMFPSPCGEWEMNHGGVNWPGLSESYMRFPSPCGEWEMNRV